MLIEEIDKKILQEVINHFGVTNTPYKGPSFILPSGQYLDLRNYTHHSDVEKFLIDKGYSSNPYVPSAGSPTMKSLGVIRVDTPKYYIQLPDYIASNSQLSTLEEWLDFCSDFLDMMEVNAHGTYKMYSLKYEDYQDTTPAEYITDRVRRYYITGNLLEDKEVM